MHGQLYLFDRSEMDTMRKKTFIRVVDIVGGPICVSTDDGQKLYEKVASVIRDDTKIVLSFEQVKYLIPAFFNAAIGKLYEEFTEERINQSISFRDMPTGWEDLHRHLMDRAKDYFENREAYDRAWKEEMGEEDWL